MRTSTHDQWAQWLLHRRHGGDPDQQKAVLDALYPVRDQVLHNAKIAEGDSVLDVGTGDGLIAFGALAQVGERGKIIFNDFSQDLLDQCHSLAQHMGVDNQCQFLQASADDLSMLDDVSVDVVTTRSVLIFVSAKQQAFREFYRVLKPRGRLSIFEPINRFGYPEPPHMFGRYEGYDVTPIMDVAQKIRAVYEHIQPQTDPMMDFDERDLLSISERMGFEDIHLELRVQIIPVLPKRWDVFLRSAGNPKIPTLEEAMNQILTYNEAKRFVVHLRPLVETGQGTKRSAVAYLWAAKP